MKFKSTLMTVADFIKLKLENKIKLDPSFQVGTDKVSRWGKREQKKYLRSILKSAAPTPFILVNIKAALKDNKELGLCDDSIEYFKKLDDEGYLYVSIDGNNRSITLQNFENGEVNIPADDYEDNHNRTIEVKKGKDRVRTLNKILLKKFYETELSVVVYYQVQKKDLPMLFRNINDGIKLNAQQIRQSYPSAIADYVRNKRSQFETSLRQFIQNKSFIVLKADEFIAKCIAYATYNESDKKTLDNVYMKGQVNKIVKPGSNDSPFNRVLNTTLNSMKVGLANLKKSPNAVFDYFCIMYDLKTKNIKVDKPKEFYALWLETTGKMFADTTREYEYQKKEGGIFYKEIFKDIVRHPYKKAQEFRKKLVLDKIEKIAYVNNIIIQQEDPNDYFSYDDKVIMHTRQKGICPGTNKKIPFEEITDFTKWHGDAKKSKDKGGTHTLDNGQLVCAKYNIKKSNN